ncbi:MULTISPECIES: glycosyltransferase family 4 protein [unclassified Microbacterium]|uniref:glycosyltransferase family 4 protein n=1 Tax=unclassified Microbacterium TaxID=2609290 RepID=UPI0038678A5E
MTTERWLVATTEFAGLTAYTGGIGRHYAALVPALARLGVEIDLLVFSDGPTVAGARPDGIRRLDVVRTERMPRLVALAARALHTRRMLRRRYDRVFAPEWMGLGSALPADAPLLTNLATGIALAHEVAGLRPRDLPLAGRIVARAQAVLEARQIRRSRGIIAISRAMQERTHEMTGGLGATRIVRNCIDVAGVRAAARGAPAPAGWPGGQGPVVLFLGRAERRKGVEDAVAAFGLLCEHGPSVRLVMAGAGGDARFEPTRSALLTMVRPEDRTRVTWLGHVADDSLYAAIAAADVVMCPSRWEGFGLVALEAMAIGTPLVVTTGSGFDDFCADGVDALMVPPGDAAALADALERTLGNPGAAQERAQRASRTVERFAPGPVAIDLRAAADDLLGPVPAGLSGGAARRSRLPAER